MDVKKMIAQRVAQELNQGDVVNLGIGLPTMVADYISTEDQVIFQSENGFIGLGPTPAEGCEDWDLTNCGCSACHYIAVWLFL